jgi:MSHA pilin protein MshA
MHSTRQQVPRQSGFTLIELIATIGVLGVVSATALPRLTALGGEARYASLKVAQGALLGVASAAHGKFLIDGAGTQAFEDVTLPMVNGYPGAHPALADAAGLARGYTVQPQGAGALRIVPKDLAATGAARCYLVYTQSQRPHAPPTVAIGADSTAATCG